MERSDFLEEKIWVTAESGMAEAAEEDSGIHRRRWVVRMRRPDLRRGKAGSSSDSRSTGERREHSISFGRRTGRPLVVSSTVGRNFPASMEGHGGWVCRATLRQLASVGESGRSWRRKFHFLLICIDVLVFRDFSNMSPYFLEIVKKIYFLKGPR